MENVVCFFTDKYFWHDGNHKFDIEVDIDEKCLTFGEGIYFASKAFGKTKVWTGRRGKVEYMLREAYAESYDSSNIKRILDGGHFADWYMKENILQWAEKNGITILKGCYRSYYDCSFKEWNQNDMVESF